MTTQPTFHRSVAQRNKTKEVHTIECKNLLYIIVYSNSTPENEFMIFLPLFHSLFSNLYIISNYFIDFFNFLYSKRTHYEYKKSTQSK